MKLLQDSECTGTRQQPMPLHTYVSIFCSECDVFSFSFARSSGWCGRWLWSQWHHELLPCHNVRPLSLSIIYPLQKIRSRHVDIETGSPISVLLGFSKPIISRLLLFTQTLSLIFHLKRQWLIAARQMLIYFLGILMNYPLGMNILHDWVLSIP